METMKTQKKLQSKNHAPFVHENRKLIKISRILAILFFVVIATFFIQCRTSESGSDNSASAGDVSTSGSENSTSGGDGSKSGSGDSSSDGGTTSGGGDSSSDGGTTPGGGDSSSDGGTTPGGGDSSSDGGTTPGDGDSSSDGGTTPGGGDTTSGVPATPTNLVVETLANRQLKVSWSPSAGTDHYNVYRTTSDNPPNEINKINTDQIKGNSFQDAGSLDQDTYYYYWIRSCNTSGCSAYSKVAAGIIKPKAPEDVKALGKVLTQFDINWQSSIGATYYAIYRKTSNDTPSSVDQIKNNHTDINYQDIATFKAFTRYHYWVTACNAVGCSDYSKVALIQGEPLGIADLTYKLAGAGKAQLTWKTSAGANRYEIVREISGDSTSIKLTSNTASFLDKDLKPSAYYYYSIKACTVSCSRPEKKTVRMAAEVIASTFKANATTKLGEVLLSWKLNDIVSPTLVGGFYQIVRSSSEGTKTITGGSALAQPVMNTTTQRYEISDKNLTPGTAYTYTLTICNKDAMCPDSVTVTYTP